MRGSSKVIVAGGGLAGMRTAEALRSKGFQGDVVILSKEADSAYNRPPLSKSALHAAVTAADVPLRMRKGIEIDWRMQTAVTGVDLTAHEVQLSNGSAETYDHLVVATGVRPRRLDMPGPQSGRHVLRTVADAAELAGKLGPGRRLVVLGAGFLGTEVAWTARQLGSEVTVVAPESEPLVGPLGPAPAAALRRRSEASGVVFRTGRSAREFLGDSTIRAVVLDDGDEIPADVVLEAIGSLPNTEWLASTGLDVSAGVQVNDQMQAIGAPELLAVGDVACAPIPLLGGRRARLEHWTHAGESARRAAASILGDTAAFATIPGFWTEQCGVRVDGYGFPGSADQQILLAGDWDSEFLARCELGGELVGILSVGFVKESGPLIRELTARASEAVHAS